MRPILERTFPASRVPTGATGWYAISVAWLCAGLLTVAFIEQNWHLASLARSNEAPASISNRSHALGVPDARAPAAPVDFVSALPSVVDPDATIRFTSRLAQDQEVRISQMQSQSIATDAKKLVR